jgi:hypothetical protein
MRVNIFNNAINRLKKLLSADFKKREKIKQRRDRGIKSNIMNNRMKALE